MGVIKLNCKILELYIQRYRAGNNCIVIILQTYVYQIYRESSGENYATE